MSDRDDRMAQRLRDAMHAAVAGEQPPANLLHAVLRRRRRHRARAVAAGAAAVVIGALVVPPAASSLRGPGPGAGAASSAARARAPAAAPGTVLATCASQIAERLPRDWRAQSIQAGPVWFVSLKQATATFYRGKVAISGLLVQVRSGVTARVTVAGSAAGHFRFLFGPRDFTDGVGGRYTVASGENGVTFAGCPGSSSFVPGYTQFGGHFLVDKIPRRVSLEVRSGAARPVTVTFLVGH